MTSSAEQRAPSGQITGRAGLAPHPADGDGGVPDQGVAGRAVVDQAVADRALLRRLSVAAKVGLLTGADSWRIPGCPPIGLRPMVTSDGPSGVRGVTKDERLPSACLPCPSALGATWDPALVHELGAALGAEARAKSVDVLLAPTINLMRTPLGGRGFECFAEDPVLTARLAVAYVRGVQAAGVAATPKHFVANDSETGRWGYDARIAPQVLRELYLAPFEACVREAGAWLVMAAYNGVNGTTMTQNGPLLRDLLKGEWGFDGVVTSDWDAARSTVATALGGLDLVMPGPAGPWGDLLAAAVADGAVRLELLDDKVLRLLRLARGVGALDDLAGERARPAALPAARPAPPPAGSPAVRPAGEGLLRRAAAASFVLLRNERATLPLDLTAVRRVAVAGPNAFWPTIQGGGSAGVVPAGVSTPADAIRAALPAHVEVTAVTGCQTWELVPAPPAGALTDPVSGAPGVRLEFRAADGTLLASELRSTSVLSWWDGLPAGVGWGESGRIVLRAEFRPAAAGPHVLGVCGVGELALRVDGKPLIRAATAVPADPVEAMTRPGELRAQVWLGDGAAAALEVELTPAADGAGPLTVRLGIVPAADDDALLDAAQAAAAGADAAVVVVGSAELTESEGFDRVSLALPGRQDELVARVAAACPRTIVVVNSGMPVLLPWAESVQAIVYAWLPGQAMGEALADVLLGAAEPGGRLPVTLPFAAADCPVRTAIPDAEGVLDYPEGLLIGYRGYDASGTRPRYPFGHGLGYTTWAYECLELGAGAAGAGAVPAGTDLELTAVIRNTGPRAGREVVQAYLAGPPGEPGRPVRVLASFGSAVAGPGETALVALRVPARAFARWDERAGRWTWPCGRFELRVGRSAGDLRLSAEIWSG